MLALAAPIRLTRQSPAETARAFSARIYADAYASGMNVSQYLEHADPTAERPEAERGMNAFERVLREAGIRTSPIPDLGIHASTWEEATADANTRAMMHEWAATIWRRPVPAETRALLLSGDAALNTILNAYSDDTTPRVKRLVAPIPLDAIVARRTQISGVDYRSLYITDDLNNDAYRLKRVTEGARIPVTTMVTGEHTISAVKSGRALLATYEQLRRQRLDRIAFIIDRMRLQSEVDKALMAMNVLINGDGNANTAGVVVSLTALDPAATAGTLTLAGWLAYKVGFTAAYNLDTIFAREDAILSLLLLPVNTVNGTPLAMLPAGVFGGVRPLTDYFGGVVRYGITSDAPSLKLVGFDSSIALEMIEEIGGNVSEVERFIVDQTQILTLTEVVGFGIIDPNATIILNINA